MWLAEALKPDCDVTVMTTGGWDLDGLNGYYGTSLNPGDVTLRLAPTLAFRAKTPAALRGALYQRFARRIAPEYDLRISACNPGDWGLPAIHFIADFTWHHEIWETYTPRSPGWVYRDTLLRRAYLWFVRACESPSGRNPALADRVVANSQWSADLIRRYCKLQSLPVIYPPVWVTFPCVPWPEKEDAFVMIGRIASEKRIDTAIRVLAELRRRGYQLKLHLCGKVPQDPYGRMVADLCTANREWIIAHGLVSGPFKANLLARAKYGIQMCAHEAFGISVAEMVKAGAVVFAPSHGGQAEILGHPDLLFSNEAEAVEKIQAVFEQPDLQVRMRTHLASRGEAFSAQRFMCEARACIAESLVEGQGADPAVAGRQD
jgi:glycosyltransferase involved in cell wall biosynthesis